MRRNIDDIEIREPPVRELGKKSSCLRKSCSTGCGCVVIFLAASLIILKLSAGPRQKELKDLPAHFPAGIPVYDISNADSIIITYGKEKGRWLETVAYVPKLIVAPTVILLGEKLFPDSTGSDENKFSQFARLLKKPVTDHRDTVQIEWTELTAEPRFVYDYYKNELEKTGFSTEILQNNDQQKQFAFKKDIIEGAVYIKDNPENKGTDYVSLTASFSSE